LFSETKADDTSKNPAGRPDKSDCVPKITDVRTLRVADDSAEKRGAPQNISGPSLKKQKTTGEISLIDSAQTNEDNLDNQKIKNLCSPADEDTSTNKRSSDYKVGPEIPGLTPYCPIINHDAISQQFASASSHYLYSVNDSEKWGISEGTFLAFEIDSLKSLLALTSGPNILSKKSHSKSVKTVFRDHLFEEVRCLARAMFSKGTLMTIQSTSKNQTMPAKIDQAKTAAIEDKLPAAKLIKPDGQTNIITEINEKGNV